MVRTAKSAPYLGNVGTEAFGGKPSPWSALALPTHPHQRGDPATPPESESADGVSVTG